MNEWDQGVRYLDSWDQGVYSLMRPRETAKFVWNQLTKANQKTHAADDFRQDLHFTYPPVCKCMMIHWLYTIWTLSVAKKIDHSLASEFVCTINYVMYIHFFFENRARSDEGKGGWIPEKRRPGTPIVTQVIYYTYIHMYNINCGSKFSSLPANHELFSTSLSIYTEVLLCCGRISTAPSQYSILSYSESNYWIY